MDETRCLHEMLQWPVLGLSSCAICKGMDAPPGLEASLPDLYSDIHSILEGNLL